MVIQTKHVKKTKKEVNTDSPLSLNIPNLPLYYSPKNKNKQKTI